MKTPPFFQTTTNNKGREGKAARNLIAKIPDLEGGGITADASHECGWVQDYKLLTIKNLTEIRVKKIFSYSHSAQRNSYSSDKKNGHLLAALKGNRSRLLNEVIGQFKRRKSEQNAHDRDVYCGHGRIETRGVDIIPF